MKLVYICSSNARSTESDVKTIVLYMTLISDAPIGMPASNFAGTALFGNFGYRCIVIEIHKNPKKLNPETQYILFIR